MNKITELKSAELSAVNGGLDCSQIASYVIHIAVVGWQHWIEMKKIVALKGSGDSSSWHAFNSSPSKTNQFIKKAKNILLAWKGSKSRFGWFEDGRYLD